MLVWRTEFGRGVIFFGKLNKPCGYWFCQKWLLIISKRPKKSSEWCYFILTPPTDHGNILRRSPPLILWLPTKIHKMWHCRKTVPELNNQYLIGLFEYPSHFTLFGQKNYKRTGRSGAKENECWQGNSVGGLLKFLVLLLGRGDWAKWGSLGPPGALTPPW